MALVNPYIIIPISVPVIMERPYSVLVCPDRIIIFMILSILIAMIMININILQKLGIHIILKN